MKLSFFKVHGIDISIERFTKKGKGDPRSSAKDMCKIALLAGYKVITANESFPSMKCSLCGHILQGCHKRKGQLPNEESLKKTIATKKEHRCLFKVIISI